MRPTYIQRKDPDEITSKGKFALLVCYADDQLLVVTSKHLENNELYPCEAVRVV